MSRAVRARIHRSALARNLQRARQAAPDTRVMAVVKCDGYGHGLVDAADSLGDADAFAVEDAGEAVRLREAGVQQDLILLSGFHDNEDLEASVQWRLSPVLHDAWQLEALRQRSPTPSVSAWIKVDSGMHRAGFDPADLPAVLESVAALPQVEVAGLMSHLACADDPADAMTERQLNRFLNAAGDRHLPLSLANSPAVLAWPGTHLDWIRPGMMLYGCSPMLDRDEEQLGLSPAMTLESQIIAVKNVAAGETIGYGATWRCETDTRLGVLACGYGDGYPRHAPSGTPVWVNGRAGRVLGRVSMDLMTVDLSGCAEAAPGDWVELWGRNVAASTVARHVGTIPYELVCRVAARVPRVYET